MKDEIFTKVKASIEDIFQRNFRHFDKAITGELTLREDIGLDSIDLTILQIEMEDWWNIRFDPIKDNFQKIFYSVNSLCEFLELRIGERNGK